MAADYVRFIEDHPAGDARMMDTPDFTKDVPDLVAFAIDREGTIHAASIAVVMIERTEAEICYSARLGFLLNDQQHSETLIARSIGVEAAKRCVAHFIQNFAESDHQVAFEADWAEYMGDTGRQFGVKFADTGLALAKRKIPRLDGDQIPSPKP